MQMLLVLRSAQPFPLGSSGAGRYPQSLTSAAILSESLNTLRVCPRASALLCLYPSPRWFLPFS